ncbi:MAG: riboflavin biosynthesis protein RibF [Kiritimatiellia bacterium]|jgi:riboflavin kinase/FMN adenylyltransferase|nr:riboflavin biosynthesis protein RibF [Kiritimatiellia bacterium]MDP6810143.1 riboflavin biosynthesis protein RibF [Kiritimatiellia bacterium]
MITVTDMQALRRKRRPIVLAAGFFDGLHLGHLKVINSSLQAAQAIGGKAWVLTFDKHPLRVLGHHKAPRLLTSNRHRLSLLQRMGVEGCLLLPFNRALSETAPEAFIRQLKECVPSLADIHVGRNWHFGKAGCGDVTLLRKLGRELAFTVTVTAPVIRGGEPVSSTRLRAAVKAGDLDGAAALLGRPFSILGTVKSGRRIGRKLGFPTANLDPHNEVLPPVGIYVVEALIGNTRHDAVLYYGRRPTFDDTDKETRELELHVPGLDADLYGRDIEVSFLRRLRGDRKFNSIEALKKEIAHDIELLKMGAV